MNILIWNNGEKWSDEKIRFYDYTPLTKEEAKRFIEIFPARSYIIGFVETEEWLNLKTYPLEPLKNIFNSSYIDDELKEYDKEFIELTNKIGGVLPELDN